MTRLIRDYADQKITRGQFINGYSQMQKLKGLNFDCKGTADKKGMYLTYRGVQATVRHGVIQWNGHMAQSVGEFKRLVDIDQRQVWIKKPTRTR